MRQGEVMCSSASRGFTLTCLLVLLVASLPVMGQAQPAPFSSTALCSTVDELAFDGDLANASVSWQVNLGPRTPGSNASAELRATISTDLEALGYDVSTQTHQRYGMELTNLFARWSSPETGNGQLVLSAHYDSRSVADQDENESNRTQPVPGANDAASGVAVLLELARHIPTMGLDHDVVLFFNDAEDQPPRYTLGAEAWAENLTDDEINATHAFVLLDMVGDADLQLHDVEPGNATLKSRVVQLASSLGLVAESIGCDGHEGLDVLQYDTTINIVDDHIHAHNLGIPAIDLMDTSYGEPKQYTLGSYWHTLEDTPDKVSATSLNHVGRLVELGLRTNAFVGINPNEGAETNETATDTSSEGDEGSDNDEARGSPRLALMAFVGLVAILGLLFTVEWKGKP